MRFTGNKLFEKTIYIIIILNLIAMVLESEPGQSDSYYSFFFRVELVSIVIFTLEYFIRTYEAIKDKTRYNLSFFGIIDLLAIIPFYYLSTLSMDGRFLRILRLFRVSRIIKLGRFNKSFELLGKCIHNVRRELYLTFVIAFIVLFFSATGMYYLENPGQPETFSSIKDSFWWSVASLTGVGFEEIFPLTLGGKIFGTIISLVGVGVVAVPTGLISGSFVEIINDENLKND